MPTGRRRASSRRPSAARRAPSRWSSTARPSPTRRARTSCSPTCPGIPSEPFFRSTASLRHHELDGLARDEAALRDRLQASISGADRGHQPGAPEAGAGALRAEHEGRQESRQDQGGRGESRHRDGRPPQRRGGARGASSRTATRSRAPASSARPRRRGSPSTARCWTRPGSPSASWASATRPASGSSATRPRSTSAGRSTSSRLPPVLERAAGAARGPRQGPRRRHADPRAQGDPLGRDRDRLQGRGARAAARLAPDGDRRVPRDPRGGGSSPSAGQLTCCRATCRDRVRRCHGSAGASILAGLLALFGLGLALVARRQRMRAAGVRKTKDLLELEVERRLRGRSLLEQELQAEEATLSNLLAVLDKPDLPAVERLVEAEEAHVRQILRLRAQLEGLVGRELAETLPGAPRQVGPRDRAEVGRAGGARADRQGAPGPGAPRGGRRRGGARTSTRRATPRPRRGPGSSRTRSTPRRSRATPSAPRRGRSSWPRSSAAPGSTTPRSRPSTPPSGRRCAPRRATSSGGWSSTSSG